MNRPWPFFLAFAYEYIIVLFLINYLFFSFILRGHTSLLVGTRKACHYPDLDKTGNFG